MRGALGAGAIGAGVYGMAHTVGNLYENWGKISWAQRLEVGGPLVSGLGGGLLSKGLFSAGTARGLQARQWLNGSWVGRNSSLAMPAWAAADALAAAAGRYSASTIAWTGRQVYGAANHAINLASRLQISLPRDTFFMGGALKISPRPATPARVPLTVIEQPRFVPPLEFAGPKFRTWNQFQAGTKTQFSTRAEAAKAWDAYKQANGIVTGSVRNEAAARQYLRSLADDYRTPSWMKPWLRDGRRPPSYEIDHMEPLSVGGSDTPANMRLQGADLHDIHHRFFRPWEW